MMRGFRGARILQLARCDMGRDGSRARRVPLEGGSVEVELDRPVAGDSHGDIEVGQQALDDAGRRGSTDQKIGQKARYYGTHCRNRRIRRTKM